MGDYHVPWREQPIAYLPYFSTPPTSPTPNAQSTTGNVIDPALMSPATLNNAAFTNGSTAADVSRNSLLFSGTNDNASSMFGAPATNMSVNALTSPCTGNTTSSVTSLSGRTTASFATLPNGVTVTTTISSIPFIPSTSSTDATIPAMPTVAPGTPDIFATPSTAVTAPATPATTVTTRAPRDKIYACPICDRKFERKHDIGRHIVVHSNRKPFACTFQGCPRKFKRLDHMREHRKRVHENKANSASAGPSGTSGVAGLAMDGAADDDDAAKDGLDLGGISEWED